MSTTDAAPGEPTEALFTFREAATACGVSRDTIKRRHRLGQFPRAARDEHGVWKIPASDLLAAGLPLGVERTPCPPPPGVVIQPTDELAQLRAEVADLRRRAEVAEAVARGAEAIARERADALADARLALRALTEGQQPAPSGPVAQAVPGPVEHRSAEPDRGGLIGSFRRFLGA